MRGLIFNILLAVVLTILLFLRLLRIDIPIVIFQVVSVIALIPVIIASGKALKEKTVSVDSLAAVALVFAYLAGEWYSAAFINLMLASARIFDIWTQRKSENLVKSLLKYRPETVKVKKDEHIEAKSVNEIEVGDVIIIGAGERIAVDATVISGQASVDESTLTGESIPAVKKPGDKVYSSTLSTSGSLVVKAEKIAGESTLAKIITLVEKSSLKKSKTVKLVNVFAQWYILATFAAAIILYFATGNVDFVLAILLVVCADDIAVSIPLAFTVAVARAAQSGILIKSSDVLERLPKIDVFITDKTGTLTFARPKIYKIKTFGGCDRKQFLKYLIAAEINSTHPIAKPIIEYVKKEGITPPAITEFTETPGEGMRVSFDNKIVVAGKNSFISKNGIKIRPGEQKIIESFSNTGYSILTLGINGALAGVVIFEDEPRPFVKDAISRTKKTWSQTLDYADRRQ